MNCIARQFHLLASRFGLFCHRDEPAEVHSPVLLASVVCFLSWVLVYGVAGRAIALLQVWWAETLVCALVPISLTFVTLYCSSWHPRITGAPRTLSLLLLSGIISVGLLIGMVIALLLASTVFVSQLEDFARFHY